MKLDDGASNLRDPDRFHQLWPPTASTVHIPFYRVVNFNRELFTPTRSNFENRHATTSASVPPSQLIWRLARGLVKFNGGNRERFAILYDQTAEPSNWINGRVVDAQPGELPFL